MSKMSHSHQPTMDALDAQRAKEDGIDAPTTQHTPGPWEVVEGCGDHDLNIRPKKDRPWGDLAIVMGGNFAEGQANARLIAAAPETARERDTLKASLHTANILLDGLAGKLGEAEAQRDELLTACKKGRSEISTLEKTVRGFLPDIDDPVNPSRAEKIRENCQKNGPSVDSVKTLQMHCKYAREAEEIMDAAIANAGAK